MTLRERYLESLRGYYEFDHDQETGTDDLPLTARGEDGDIRQFVLVQGYDNGRTWHVFADTVEELTAYQAQEEFGWWPILIADLETGKTANVVVACSAEEFGTGVETFEPADDPDED